jgi:antitoxin component YwqK of YwqJK toxin-antitoxin module/tetratricopeptide (TPR) repeat protein
MNARYYGAAVALLTLPGFSQAQTATPTKDPVLPDAAAIFKEGSALREKEQYDEAVARYSLITPGDSAYADAQSELAIALLGAKKYSEAVAAAQRSLAAEPFSASTLGILASAQEENKQFDAARQTYANALKLYPYNEALWLDRAIGEYNQGQMAPAFTYLQRAALLRPLHGTPHRLLGLLAARQGQQARALISLLTYLAIEPGADRSQGVLVLVEKISSGQPIVEESEKVTSVVPNTEFEELDQLITSKVALNKDYLTKVKFNAALVKQTQLLVEKFPVDADPASDFWVRVYAPLVKVLRQEDNLTTFTYLVLYSANDDRARQWVKSNKSRVEKLTDALSGPIQALHNQQPLPDGKLAAAWYTSTRLEGLGPGTRDADGSVTPTAGPWLFLGKDGEIRERGSYAGPAKRGGLWQTLRPDGSVELEQTYASTGASQGELDGTTRMFYPGGQPKSEGVYRTGKIEGTAKSYAPTGKVSETRQFVGDDLEGEVVSFYPDGKPSYRAQMRADKKEGPLQRFYPDGTPEMRFGYTADQLQGPYEVFYPNKTLEKKGTYDKDELNGPYTLNHPNGQPRETGTYTKGKRTGLWRAYYASGKLSVEETFDEAGKTHGVYHDYDSQGRLLADTYYDHGRIVRMVHFNAAGKATSDVAFKKGRQEVKTYDLEGRVRNTGFIENGNQAGEWRRFFADGALREVAHYDAATGNQVGASELYYANGQLRQRSNFASDGNREGYFEQFYVDGQREQTGFYHLGQPQGVWKSYSANGRLSQQRELNGGELNGPMLTYETGGKPTGEWTYAYGKLRQAITYDSTGRVAQRQELPATATEVQWHFPGSSGQPAVLNRAGLADGDYEGSQTWLYPNGQPEVTMHMHGGKRYGPYRVQYPSGQTSVEGEYLNGERYGQFSNYYADGTLQNRGRYLAGQRVGEWTFNFPNGKLEKVLTFDDEGELQGPSRYYNPAGELVLEQRYEQGSLVSSLAPGAAPGTAAQVLPPAGGTVQVAFANGKPAASETYQHGYPAAPFVYYYSTGQVFRRVNYQKGLRSGALVSYWPSGKPMEEENYQHGELHGRCRYYRPDGTLEREETYCAGEHRGPTTYYNAQGKPERTEAYWNNSFYTAR